MPETIVPVFAIMLIFGAPVAAWIVSRVLAHQERMAMIRNGFMPPPDPRMMRNMRNMAPPPNMGMPPGAVPPPMPGAYDDTYYAQAALRKGIMVTCIGFAIFVGLSFIGHDGMGHFYPGPWLLGGLIPMFVGIAQVISALLSGARLPQFGGGMSVGTGAHFGPPPQANRPQPQAGPPPPQPPPPPQTGPYAWRPGSTPEIEDHNK